MGICLEEPLSFFKTVVSFPIFGVGSIISFITKIETE